MIKILQKILTIESRQSDGEDLEHSLHVATAVLLVEVMRADFIVQAEEKARLRQLLEQQFSLSADQLDALLDEAETRADRMVSIQHTTRLLNEHFHHAMKIRVVEMMWQLVYADGDKDRYEEHLIRQVAELLYLSHTEFIQARLRAEEEN
ncbi:MAG TPA: TerB family tellurite resistance protein [Gammaproteobacteria bacterium]|nr:TerB family tellurite resistance protein [Gammaproteobacteria bacterium]